MMLRGSIYLLILMLPGAEIARQAAAQPAAPRDNGAPSARARLANQRRAREMTRQLVEGVLDEQLRQLQENDLRHLPIYRDIAEMRGHLDGLIESEMRDVVDLLARQVTASPAAREPLTAAARRLTRRIVARLSVERHNLLRRLKTADLSAQVRRLIERQSSVYDATRSMSALAANQRDAAIATALDDQRDVSLMFDRLMTTLDDVSDWQGQVAALAAECLESIKLGQTPQAVQSAAASLESANVAQAALEQQRVLLGLRLILDRIEETQGLLSAGREAALDEFLRLTERQREIAERSRSADLAGADGDELVNAQAELAQTLDRLRSELRLPAVAEDALDRARAAADNASRLLFDQQQEAAAGAQDNVIQEIADIATRLRDAANLDRRDKSADQHAALADRLHVASEKLRESLAGGMPQQAADAAALANTLRAMNSELQLPAGVDAHVSRAADALEEAAADAGADRLSRARQATERAESEILATQADAVQRATAMRIGEWNRVEESLRRASSMQRRISDAAAEALNDRRADESLDLERLANEQQRLATFVERAAAALTSSLSDASELVNSGAAPAAKAHAALRAAAQAAAGDRAEALRAAAQSAADAAARLQQAADRVRDAMAAEADRLGALARQQRDRLRPAEAALGETLDRRTRDSTSRQDQVSLAESLAETMRSLDPGALAALHAAANAASEPERPRSEESLEVAEQAWQRAAASLAARGLRLDRHSELAGEVSNQLERQAEAIQQLAAKATADPSLEQKLADAWRTIGQAAEEIAGQSLLANDELLAALQAVAESYPVELPPDVGGWRLAADMGRGLEPRSAEVTARLLVGGDLNGLIATSAERRDNQNQKRRARSSPGSKTVERLTASDATPRERATVARERAARPATEGAETTANAVEQLQRQPWFTRLPAEVRRAIRAEARRPPPRGYEDRLQRYFSGMGQSPNQP